MAGLRATGLTVSAMLHPARQEWPATRHTALNRWKILARRRWNGKLVLDKAALKLDAQGNGRLLISRLPALDRPIG